jgi:hypothetical protein
VSGQIFTNVQEVRVFDLLRLQSVQRQKYFLVRKVVVLDFSWWLVHVASRIRLGSRIGYSYAGGFVCQQLTIVWLYLTSMKSCIGCLSTIYTCFDLKK